MVFSSIAFFKYSPFTLSFYRQMSIGTWSGAGHGHTVFYVEFLMSGFLWYTWFQRPVNGPFLNFLFGFGFIAFWNSIALPFWRKLVQEIYHACDNTQYPIKYLKPEAIAKLQEKDTQLPWYHWSKVPFCYCSGSSATRRSILAVDIPGKSLCGRFVPKLVLTRSEYGLVQ